MTKLRREPFGIVYERFLYSDVSDRAIRLLLVLDRHAEKGHAFPGRPRLAEMLGCSVDTVDRLVRELEGVGAVTTVRVNRPGGGRPLPTYYLWPATPETDDQSRTDAALQSRTHAATKPHPRGIEAAPVRNRALYGEQEPINETTPSPADAGAPAAPSFEDFWQVYPRKTGKGAARTAWEKATRKASARDIANAAWRYARDPNRDPQYTPHPATWLNQERWEDEPLPLRAGAGARPLVDRIDQDRDAPSGFLVAP